MAKTCVGYELWSRQALEGIRVNLPLIEYVSENTESPLCELCLMEAKLYIKITKLSDNSLDDLVNKTILELHIAGKTDKEISELVTNISEDAVKMRRIRSLQRIELKHGYNIGIYSTLHSIFGRDVYFTDWVKEYLTKKRVH